MEGNSLKIGPLSGDFYILGKVNDGSDRALTARLVPGTASTTVTWDYVHALAPLVYSLVVDSAEIYIYFLENSFSFKIIQIKSSDGSINGEFQTDFKDYSLGYVRLTPIAGINGFAMMAYTDADKSLFCL
jgi:hypothetical protein